MLAIKLKRIGKKHQPSFRIIVAEKRSKVDGRFVEDLGWYNPFTNESKIDAERANYWIKNGAQPTHSVLTLFKKYDILNNITKGRKEKS
jgi:small subunit ribosomal protein S16